jgi:hypothetical protein
MKIVRLIFYILSVIVICEVTDIISLSQNDVSVCFSSDWEESPVEEDESRELEDDDEYFIESLTPVLYPIRSIPNITPSLFFELTEPLNEITVPPPQA